jgi:hypothetical protein
VNYINRYVLKINNSTFVEEIDWIAMEIPTIKTNSFQNAMLVTDEYLDYIVIRNCMKGFQTRKDLISIHYPNIQIKKVELVIIEEYNQSVHKEGVKD